MALNKDSIRGLTAGEINALPPGLLAVIPVAEVRLVGRHHWVSTMAQWVGRGAQIVVRGRRIFWPGLMDDFSGDPLRMSLLAHELVHVWQYETGMTLWKYIRRERGRYDYAIDGRAYVDYGYEQQAAMMEDWMRLHAGFNPWYGDVDLADLEAVLPFVKQETPPPRPSGAVPLPIGDGEV